MEVFLMLVIPLVLTLSELVVLVLVLLSVRRQAVACEAIAEAQGSLVDVTLAQAELAAHRTNPSPPPEELLPAEWEARREAPAAQLDWNVTCVGCGSLIALCRCKLGSVLRRRGNGSKPPGA